MLGKLHELHRITYLHHPSAAEFVLFQDLLLFQAPANFFCLRAILHFSTLGLILGEKSISEAAVVAKIPKNVQITIGML